MMAIILFLLVSVLVTAAIYVTYSVLSRREHELLRFAVVSKKKPWVQQLNSYYAHNQVTVLISAAAALLLLLGHYLLCATLVLAVIARSRYLRSQKRKEILENLPGAIAIMTRSLRSGQTIENAMKSVIDFTASEEIRMLFKRILHMVYISGKPIHEVLFDQAKQNRLNEMTMLASILDTHAHVGGNITEVLTIFEEQMRRTMVTEKKVASLMSEGRTSIMVLAAIPLLVVGAVWNTTPDYLTFFFTEEGRFGLILVVLFYLSGIGFSIAFVRGR